MEWFSKCCLLSWTNGSKNERFTSVKRKNVVKIFCPGQGGKKLLSCEVASEKSQKWPPGEAEFSRAAAGGKPLLCHCSRQLHYKCCTSFCMALRFRTLFTYFQYKPGPSLKSKKKICVMHSAARNIFSVHHSSKWLYSVKRSAESAKLMFVIVLFRERH